METYLNEVNERIREIAAAGKTSCRIEWNNCWRTVVAPRDVPIEDVVARLKETYRKVEIQKMWYAGMGKYVFEEDLRGLNVWMSTYIFVDWTEDETYIPKQE